ncbi:MAG: hypothetical protein LBK26_02840 [Rickettsiales bacterium]|jgi:hypothetical protein|nr:hypothetical protein [Rickettsiales bacterium]
MKKKYCISAICPFIFVLCAAPVHADDVSVGRAAIASVAAAKSAAMAPSQNVASRVGIARNISQKNPDAAPESENVGDQESTAAAVSRVAVPPQNTGTTASRAAIQNVTAARAAGGNDAARQGMVRQSVSRGYGSRAAAMASAQSEERDSERAKFHSNEKGVANESSAVRRAGVTLRPTFAEVGGRATIAGTDTMTGSNVVVGSGRTPTARAAASGRPTAASIAETTEKLTLISSLQDSCNQQYMDCMDQFCNVLDANQGRCSCSDRLSTYSKTERAVKDANSQLNEVAQRIRYVGLAADEIRAIMKATEAELAMQGQKDTTENRVMLDQIEKLIKNPETFVNEATGNSLDLDFNIDFENMDTDEMFNLEMFGNNGSFSNMRGTALYNAAKGKCKNILNTCKTNGANSSQISARYDMEVDKGCVAFEKGLDKMNQTLKTNVRAATNMLQQARLEVLNNQNSLDAKGCIGALESCMTDDMVCGENYVKCMDPTKNYIDENGAIVLGRDVTVIRDMMTSFSAEEISLSTVIGDTSPMNVAYCIGTGNDGRCIVKYLLNKIGMGESATSGLCRVVLDKCQKSTYSDGKYNPTNYVVENYIRRAMVNIRANQETVIAEYASSCMQDVAYCYSQQVSQLNAWSSSASASSIQTIMSSACRNVALTCGFAIFGEPQNTAFSADSPYCTTETTTSLCRYVTANPVTGLAEGSCPLATGTNPDMCINSVSEIFYQTMLCPENSSFTIPATGVTPTAGKIYVAATDTTTALTDANRVWLNERCLCNPGYGYLAGRCVLAPSNSSWLDTCVVSSLTGQCVIVGYQCTNGANGFIPQNSTCVKCPEGKTAGSGSCNNPG